MCHNAAAVAYYLGSEAVFRVVMSCIGDVVLFAPVVYRFAVRLKKLSQECPVHKKPDMPGFLPVVEEIRKVLPEIPACPFSVFFRNPFIPWNCRPVSYMRLIREDTGYSLTEFISKPFVIDIVRQPSEFPHGSRMKQVCVRLTAPPRNLFGIFPDHDKAFRTRDSINLVYGDRPEPFKNQTVSLLQHIRVPD